MSNIDATKPTAGTALTADVRSNFATAKSEIEALGNGSAQYAAAGGTVDAITVSLVHTITSYTDGLQINVRAAGANTTTTPTLNIDSVGAKTIKIIGNEAIRIGDIPKADYECIFRYNSTNDVFELLNPALYPPLSGAIGGWNINNNYIDIGSGASHMELNPSTGIWLGADTIGAAPFSVTPAGVLTAESGAIGGWTINASEITKGNISIDSANERIQAGPSGSTYVRLDASGIVGVDSVLGTTFNLPTDGSAPTFSSGIINSTTFNITSSGILETSSTAGDGSASGQGVRINDAGLKAWAANNATAKVHIDASTGIITATDAVLSGTITATAGAIGGWTLAANYLTAGSGSNTVRIDSGGSNPAFSAGSATPGSAPFRVTQAGALTAQSGTIGGWTLGASDIAYSTTMLLDGDGGRIQVGDSAGSYMRLDTSTGLTGVDNTLGTVFNLPLDGSAPTFSSGIINSTVFNITSAGILETSANAGNGSTAGVRINDVGIKGWDNSSATPNFFLDATDGTITAVNADISGTVTIGSGSSGIANLSDAGELAVADFDDYRVANSNTEGSVTTIKKPVGGSVSGGSSTAGAIVITLPQSWTDTMMKFVVDVYLHESSKSFTALVGGYNYTTETLWNKEFAQIIGNTGSNNRVRFGHDGTKCVVVIGDTTDVWGFPKITVRDFQAGYTNYSIGQWDDGWSVSFETDLTGYTFTGDFSDALLDAKAILNQGALATTDSADWSSQVSGGGKPSDNADVTQTALIAGTTITGGGITLSSGGALKSFGKDSYADTTDGIYIGYDATETDYVLNIGDGNSYIKYDPTDKLQVATNVTSSQAITINPGGDNEIHFYGDRGDGTVEELATIGITNDGSDYFIGDFGNLNSGNSRVAIRGRSFTSTAGYFESDSSVGVRGESSSSVGVYGVSSDSSGVRGFSAANVGVLASTGSTVNGAFKILPKANTTDPTGGSAGEFVVLSDGTLKFNDGTSWKTVSVS